MTEGRSDKSSVKIIVIRVEISSSGLRAGADVISARDSISLSLFI